MSNGIAPPAFCRRGDWNGRGLFFYFLCVALLNVRTSAAGSAAEAMAGTRALLNQAQDGQTEGLFTQAAELWKSALDEKVNAAYKAADKSVKPLVANWSMVLNILCDADSGLYSLLYPTKPYIVEEHVMDLYKDAVLTIESIE